MADTPDDGPSLEMPSFSLRRRRREAEATEPESTPDVADAGVPVDGVPVDGVPDAGAVDDEPVPRRRRGRTAPAVTGPTAALLTGLAVGALAVAYAWLAGAGCEAVRGTTACGGAAGLPLLLAGLVLLAWVGAVLLRFFGVPDAGSTSILAVGILAVLVMLFLLEALDEWWAVVVVPLMAVGGYALSWWVTSSVVGDEAGPDVPEPHDVR